MHGDEKTPWIVWVFWSLVLVTLLRHYTIRWQRRRSLPLLASRLGLKPFGEGSTPRDLYLEDSSLDPVDRVFNVFSGASHSVPVCFFDVAKRRSKGSEYFTVLAARGADPFGAEVFDPDLYTERVGAWTLLHSSRRLFFGRRLLSIVEIEAQIRSVRPEP